MLPRPILPALATLTIALPLHAADFKPSASLMGPLGLNVVPSARMHESGTITGGMAAMDPYLHGYLGVQIAAPLYIGLRQSAEASNIRKEADRLYPGIDLKLRLLREGPHNPEIALGLQSAVGHRRMAGEYLAASKRFGNFDFTGGIGWGRMGSAAQFKNPLKSLMDHFGKSRSIDGEMPNEPQDWFTGSHIGLFGGIEYFTPIDHLSIKADWGADRYAAERAAFDFSAPAPWSIGLAYQPTDWLDAGIAAQGTDKIMARLSLKSSPGRWPWAQAPRENAAPMHAYRTGIAVPGAMQTGAHSDGVLLYDIKRDTHTVSAGLSLSPYHSAPWQIGAAARNIANHAGPATEEITIFPSAYNLRGPSVSLNRRDLEQALGRHQGSADEIWANAVFNAKENHSSFSSRAHALNQFGLKSYKFILDNQMSLAEEDSGTLYRSSVIFETEGPDVMGWLHTGTAIRLNLADNLARINEIRPPAFLPVRSNIADFAAKTFGLERAYAALTHSLTPEIHTMGAAGYLEEMYGGAGGEILYRPFGLRYALGADAWLALKRDPISDLNLMFNGDRLISGHLNGWYEFPDENLSASLKLGRFLAEDFGGRFGLTKTFDNGAKLEGFLTYTNLADFDLFGGTTHAYHGVRLSVPLGGSGYLPPGSDIRLTAAPFGRDTGQSLDAPIKLYEATQGFSQSHLAHSWHEITE